MRDFHPGLGTQFKPGDPPGPGRPKTLPEVAGYPRLSRDALAKMLTRVFTSNLQELKSIMSEPTTPALTLAYVKVMIKAIEKGDPSRLEAMMTRVIGPAPILEIHDAQQRVIESLSKEELIGKIQLGLERLKGSTDIVDVTEVPIENKNHES